MKIELIIPLFYAVKREVYRTNVSLRSALLRFIFDLFRFWLWIMVFIYFQIDSLDSTGFLLHLIAFMLIYESGYILTDLIGIQFERSEVKKTIYEEAIDLKVVLFAVSIRMVTLSSIYTLFYGNFSSITFMGHIFTLIFYVFHCFSKETFRLVTFFLLRCSKGLVPFLFILNRLSLDTSLLISVGVLAMAFYAAFEYWSGKLCSTWHNDFNYWGNSYLVIPIAFIIVGFTSTIHPIAFSNLETFFAILISNYFFFSLITFTKRSLSEQHPIKR